MAVATGQSTQEVAAAEAVRDRVERGGAGALRLLLALAHAAPDDAALGVAGAGPVEDLLVGHGDELRDEIAGTARREPRFARALGFETTFRPATTSVRRCVLRWKWWACGVGGAGSAVTAAAGVRWR
jgi:hypothetical protein